MILYKYMSFQAAMSVITNQSIGFSNLEDFNDPFEGRALVFSSEGGIPSELKAKAYHKRLRKCGVLSLTRNPMNALMWAHYGDEHRGIVLGVDVDVAGLNNPETSLIPANLGDLIYTSTHPNKLQAKADFDSLVSIGSSHSFSFEDYEFYRSAFLYKDTSWSYEEEVRVVKNIEADDKGWYKPHKYQNPSGHWSRICIQNQRPLHCYSLPKASITEVYLGYRAIKNPEHPHFLNLIFKDFPEVDIFDTYPDENSWNLVNKKILGV